MENMSWLHGAAQTLRRGFAVAMLSCLPLVAADYSQILEAEEGNLNAERATVTADATASGGRCVTLSCKGRLDNPAGEAAAVELLVTVPRGGRYQLDLSVYAENGSTDSCYVQVDDGNVQSVFFDVHKTWHSFALRPQQLAKGTHKIRVIPRESGMKLDTVKIHQERYTKASLETFKAPPVWPEKGVHPRLLLRKADIETIRGRLTHPENLPVWNQVKALVAAPVAKELDSVKDLAARGVWSARMLGQIEARAFVYLLEGNTQAGQEAVEAMCGFLRTVALKDGFQDVTRPIGQTIFMAAIVYDWCYPLMTAELKTEFIERCEDLCGHMEVGFPPLKQGNVTGHGGEAQIFRDLLSFGIAVFDEMPEMYRICAGRFFDEMVEPRNRFYPSGRHHQGNAYGAYRFSWEIFGGWVFRRLCGLEVYDSSINGMNAFWLYGRLPNGAMLEDGDNYQRPGRYAIFTDAPFMHYTYTRNPLSKAEFWRQDGKAWALRNPVTFLLFNDPDIPVVEPETQSLSHYFGDPLGSLIARNGWGTGASSDLVVVSFKGAGVQYNNHHHADAGSFQIYHRGLLAADLGQYGRYGTPYDWSFNKQSISHNMVLVYDPEETGQPSYRSGQFVNDGGQVFPAKAGEPKNQAAMDKNGYRIGSTTAHAIGPDAMLPLYSYLKCDLSRAYGDRVSDYTRSFVYVNTNVSAQPALVFVYDYVTAAKPSFQKSWCLNSYAPPVIKDHGFEVTWNRNGCQGQLNVVSLLPEKQTIVSGKATSFHGHSFEPPFPAEPSAEGQRTEVRPSQTSATDCFLHVMAVGTAGEMQPLTAVLMRGQALTGAMAAGHAVLFAAAGKLVAQAERVAIAAEGTKVLVTDLAAGGWTVKRNGTAVAAKQVKADDHTLFFVADKAGVYDIAPSETAVTDTDYSHLKAVPTSGFSGVMVGRKRVSAAKPNYQDQLLYVPVEDVAGSAYKATAKGFTLSRRGLSCEFAADSETCIVNGMTMPVQGGLLKHNGRWLMPAFLLGQLLNFDVKTEGADCVRFVPAVEREDVIRPVASFSPAVSDAPLPNLFDGISQTYWAGRGDTGYVVMMLEQTQAVGGVELIWHQGARRDYVFDILTSLDGVTYETACSGSSKQNSGRQRVVFAVRNARFVKFVGKGNNENSWNSVSELTVLKP